MKCPKCDFETTNPSRYCGNCGSNLVMKCSACGHENAFTLVFCENCGIKLGSVAKGLMLDRALVWREQFQRMGWWEDPVDTWKGFIFKKAAQEAVKNCKLLLEKHGIPEPDSKTEPWLFFCAMVNNLFKNWNIHEFKAMTFNNGRVEFNSKSHPYQRDFLLATRCRLIFVEVLNYRVYQWQYQDINEYRVEPNGVIELVTSAGDSIHIKIKTKGASLIDYAIATTSANSKNQGQYLVATANISAAKSYKIDFMTIVGEFFKEIIDQS